MINFTTGFVVLNGCFPAHQLALNFAEQNIRDINGSIQHHQKAFDSFGVELVPPDIGSLSSVPQEPTLSSSPSSVTPSPKKYEEQPELRHQRKGSQASFSGLQPRDMVLRGMVLEQHIYNWKELARRLNCTKQTVIRQWQIQVYPRLKSASKVAGVHKWSMEQDSIMTGYIKKIGFNWSQLGVFLPGRTAFSAEGRLRRMKLRQGVDDEYLEQLEGQFVDTLQYMNKHQYRKYVIKKLALQKDN